jgi:hypothetical protein
MIQNMVSEKLICVFYKHLAIASNGKKKRAFFEKRTRAFFIIRTTGKQKCTKVLRRW